MKNSMIILTMNEEEEKFEVRDLRPKGWYWTNDEFLNGYAHILGVSFSMIYIDLCRHADKNQKAFPAQSTIAKELSLSRATVNEGIKVLRYFKLIKQKRLGKQCTNRYWLSGKKYWRKDFSELEELQKKFKDKSENEMREIYNTFKGDVNEFDIRCQTIRHLVLNNLTSNSKETQKKENTKEREEPFSFKQKLEAMSKDPKRHIQIIGLYFKIKEYQFENKEQYQRAIQRNLKGAKELIGYSNDRILEVMSWLENENTFKWTIESVSKFVDENLNRLKPIK